MNDRIIHFTLGTVVGSMITGLVAVTNLYNNILPREFIEIYNKSRAEEIIKTYNQGKADILRLNPVSWELEQTCLNLWSQSEGLQ